MRWNMMTCVLCAALAFAGAHTLAEKGDKKDKGERKERDLDEAFRLPPIPDAAFSSALAADCGRDVATTLALDAKARANVEKLYSDIAQRKTDIIKNAHTRRDAIHEACKKSIEVLRRKGEDGGESGEASTSTDEKPATGAAKSDDLLVARLIAAARLPRGRRMQLKDTREAPASVFDNLMTEFGVDEEMLEKHVNKIASMIDDDDPWKFAEKLEAADTGLEDHIKRDLSPEQYMAWLESAGGDSKDGYVPFLQALGKLGDLSDDQRSKIMEVLKTPDIDSASKEKRIRDHLTKEQRKGLASKHDNAGKNEGPLSKAKHKKD